MPHAFLLHLTPTHKVANHPYLHQYTHGLFYHLLQTIDPELSAQIHAAERNPFSLWATEQRDGGILLRVGILDDTLFQPFISVVLQESLAGLGLGQDSYRVARVLATPEGHRDAGFLNWDDLLSAEPTDRLRLRFLTPTVFATSKNDRRLYTPLPLPRLILKSLLGALQRYSPLTYNRAEAAALALMFEEVVVTRHDVRTQGHKAGKASLTGFVGNVDLRYTGSDRPARTALARLGELAFYCGVGAKTPYGMGQVRPGAFAQSKPTSRTKRVRAGAA